MGLARSLARELGSRNITANVVAPGFISTDMTAAMTEDRKAEILAGVPSKRYGTADEIAQAVRFLASDDGGLHQWRGAAGRRRPGHGHLSSIPR